MYILLVGMEAVGGSCAVDKRLLVHHAKGPWLQVMDGLLAIARFQGSLESDDKPKTFSDRLVLWRRLGVLLKIEEDEARRELATARSLTMGSLIGCSWVQCALYASPEAPPHRDLMRCAICKEVRPRPPSSFLRRG